MGAEALVNGYFLIAVPSAALLPPSGGLGRGFVISSSSSASRSQRSTSSSSRVFGDEGHIGSLVGLAQHCVKLLQARLQPGYLGLALLYGLLGAAHLLHVLLALGVGFFK